MTYYKCVHGHDRCDQMYPGADCPYCEMTARRLDGSQYVTIASLPGFHFILKPDEQFAPALQTALEQFLLLYLPAYAAEHVRALLADFDELREQYGWLYAYDDLRLKAGIKL